MRPIRFALFISFLLISFSGALTIASDPTPYDEAVGAMTAGDYELAAARLLEILDQSRDWAPGHIALGQCRYMLGDPESAESSFRRAVEIEPETDLATPYADVGKLLYRERRFLEAVSPFEQALKQAGETPQPSLSLMLSYAHLRSGNTQQARDLLDEHLTLQGPDPKASRYLGLACQRLSDYPCALSSLRQAIATGSDDPSIRRTLAEWSRYWALLPANSASRDELLAASVADTRGWYRDEPGSADAREAYVRTLADAGHSQALIEEIGSADDLDCSLLPLLARAYNTERRFTEAEAISRKAIRCSPQSAGPRVELSSSFVGRLRSEHSDLDAVRADLELATQALDALGPVLDPAHRSERAMQLAADLGETLEALARTEKTLIRRDDRYLADLEKEIRLRCHEVLWVIRAGQRDLTTEENGFDEQHDCRRYAADLRAIGS